MRALWVAGPAESAEQRIADLVHRVRARGRGVLVVAPDAADVARIAAALEADGEDPVIRLGADLGPEARYRAFLRILTGAARIVVGTRAAVFAPVVDLGAIVVWDDGDESLAEPQAPGWHAREVAALRSAATDASLVIAGRSVTLEGARMARSGWLTIVDLPRPVLRAHMPRVQVAADLGHGDPALSADRIPSVALEVLRAGVAAGPVLVGVPRAGYLPMLACQSCREQVRCPTCGVLMRAQGPERRPVCAEHPQEGPWHCPVCRGERVRAVVVGVRRTAEEFGRALPGVVVLTSSGEDHIRVLPERRGARERLVVATPGAEPDPGPEGYAALVLLDAAASLSRPGLRTAEDVLRRWFAAAGLVRPAGRAGRVLVVGDPEVREVQALVRWDPRGYADRELDERVQLHLPPAVRVAQLVGPALATGELADELADELGGRVLRLSGPLPVAEDSVSWMLAVSLADGAALSAAVHRAQVARSLRQATRVGVRMDPVRLR